MTTTISETQRRFTYYRWLIFSILALGYVLVYFHRLSPGVMALDLMESFGVGATVVGILGSAYFYPYAIMQLPAGLLSDSLGPRKSVTIFLIIAAAGATLFALSPNIQTAIAARVLVGLGVCMVFVPALKILSQWFTRGEFSMMTAILNAMGGVGVLIAAAPLAFLTERIGWRNSFFAIGAATLVLALVVWKWVRNRPDEVGLPPIIVGDETSRDAVKAIPLVSGMLLVLQNGRFWAIAIWFFFNCGVFFGLGGLWGGPYLMQVYGLSKTQAGGILNMLAVGLIIGSPVLSTLSDRVFRSRKKVMLLSALALCLTLLLPVISTDRLPFPLLYVLFYSIGMFSAAIVVIAFTATKELFPLEIAGTSVGTVNLFPFAGGAAFQPLLGYILARFTGESNAAGYRAVFIACFISAVIALISISLMKETLVSKPETK
ncbi:MAG: MFS transporter [Candidatus Abyssobacteria bacterium SURF_5]|uniref:MFS transporter n=1 Tax=Abyssobacteria bacterium (strain SURF_5) TaxID=2093360 RepID=A0A3A4NZD8_ABYX5|nr:MAG: MFS transporter [Candidatus Abyssubacteria bacterium SURF_5]